MRGGAGHRSASIRHRRLSSCLGPAAYTLKLSLGGWSRRVSSERISVLYQKRRCEPAFLIGPPDRAAVAAGELSASELDHPRDEWHFATAAGQAGFEVNVGAA